eukprot:6295357-Ditylum_brightwellii.AAC.1
MGRPPNRKMICSLLWKRVGIPSQYSFAASSHHPIMLFSLQKAIWGLELTCNAMFNNAPRTTGPRAIKVGLVDFL